jgi:hypothetical protein
MVLGVRRLANASLARAQAIHGHDQQGLGILQDKVSVREREAREKVSKGVGMCTTWREKGHLLTLTSSSKNMHRCRGCRRTTSSHFKSDLGLELLGKRVCCKTRLLPARCSTQWPHETFIRILKIFLVHLIHIFKEVELWWWWWSIW